MASTLTVRNLDDQVKHLLRVRAATHGRAMEAEVREILTRAVMPGNTAQPSSPGVAKKPVKSVCAAVRGSWKGRKTTDEIMRLSRGE